MRIISFHPSAFEHFQEWQKTDKKSYQKIVKLIQEVSRNPFTGTGLPEPLKHELQGYWSRRIDQKNRLVYKVTEEAIIILSCKNHYE